MKILFTRFPLESAHGGAEIQTLQLMQGLLKRGHAVSFVGSCPVLLSLCRTNGIPAAEVQIGPPPVSRWHAISFFWRRRRIQEILEQTLGQFLRTQLDAICMLSLSEKLLLTPAACRSGVPVFWIEHDSVGRWLTANPWLPRLKRLSGSVKTITVSRLSRDLYVRLGWDARSILAIPNGIEPERFGAFIPNDSSTETETEMHIGCVARLAQEKGVDMLLTALAELPQATLTVVGTGPQEAALQRLCARLKITDRVRWMARCDDLGNFYRSLDLFVLPSRGNDPFGLVVAEAMSLGVPTVVTEACGIAGELTPGQDGIVVPSNSARALKTAIADCLKNRQQLRALGLAGRQTVLDRLTGDRMVDRYERLLLGAAA